MKITVGSFKAFLHSSKHVTGVGEAHENKVSSSLAPEMFETNLINGNHFHKNTDCDIR